MLLFFSILNFLCFLWTVHKQVEHSFLLHEKCICCAKKICHTNKSHKFMDDFHLCSFKSHAFSYCFMRISFPMTSVLSFFTSTAMDICVFYCHASWTFGVHGNCFSSYKLQLWNVVCRFVSLNQNIIFKCIWTP